MPQWAKERVLKDAVVELVSAKRDAAWQQLRTDLTEVAESQFREGVVEELRQYEDSYVRFRSYLSCDRITYPKEFSDAENNGEFHRWGFCRVGAAQLRKTFPVASDDVYLYATEDVAPRYIAAARRYMSVFFEARKAAELLKQSLATVYTYRQFEETLPELARFCPIQDPPKQLPVSAQTIARCRELFAPAAEART
jgi:hypothetical protein